MNDTPVKIPAYLRLTLILLGGIAFFYIMYVGREIIIPIAYATMLAILLNPVVNFLFRFKINRVVAILLVLLAVIILLAALCYVIGSQASMFTDTFPQLKGRLILLVQDVFAWVSRTFNISTEKGNEWIAK